MPKRYALSTLALLLALAVLPARAQHADAIDAVKAHFLQNQARYGASDLADLAVTDAYASRRSGATYVYLQQAYRGIPVANAPAQATITAEGRVFNPQARFVADLADRVNATAPSLPPVGAADAAVRHLQRTAYEWYQPTLVADTPDEQGVAATYFLPQPDEARLIYFATEAGPVRLAWELLIDTRDGQHVWQARVDAESGRVLDLADLVDHDHWPAPGGEAAVPDLAPLASQTAASSMAASAVGTYNVWAMPVESPNHGARSMAVDPDDADASPLGWHDTGTSSYTITRGNNVYAYEDVDQDNLPGFSPDGGGSLVFDFPFDPNLQPEDYQPLAITNLFYWNNVIHDVLWHYGFDEPAGNFQTNNGPNGGLGNDAVNAEAQDGSGTDNANFFTPSDGSPPRMQMYRWSPGLTFEINTPPSIMGQYLSGDAQFGALGPYSVTGEVALALNADGNAQICADAYALVNGDELDGKIALIERGGANGDPNANCNFVEKARQAQAAGAVAVIIHNCEPGDPGCSTNSPGEGIITMACPAGEDCSDVTIPNQMVQRSTGLAMRDELGGGAVEVTMERGEIFRDSDLDNGIIVHEYAHGISNRLVGGPSNVSCLNTLEQMGEGWSDYYGLMMTQQPGDTAEQPRGVGTYVEFQPVNGIGIRAAPYSTDFAVNDFTYGDTRLLTLGQQHAVGHIWATAVWEATWELIDEHGFDPDMYNAEGTAGNQVMFQLVTEGMKQTNCAPTFIDARDGILAADTLLYGGEYSSLLWQGFARRGLGYSAFGGNPNVNADNIEAFDLPPTVESVEGTDLPAAYTLSRAYPNPFDRQAAFTLSVAQTRPVRIAVYDALGREVALLHDGDLAAGTAHRFAVEAAGLASGTYFVRVTGEDFAATERLTLLK